MTPNELARLFRGSFSFFRVNPEELRNVFPDYESVLPMPQRIFLEREEATPLVGFAVLITPEVNALREALEAYLLAEERFQVAAAVKQQGERKELEAAWQRYEGLLARALENTTRSSFGRHYPGIFWLYHSIAISRLFKELPRRILRLDLGLGRELGDAIKYRVFHRYLDRALALSHDVAHRVATETEEQENQLFPTLLSRMRDNVLILTEDYISADLGELDGYFKGCLGIDGKQFRDRFRALREWHARQIATEPELAGVGRHLLGAAGDGAGAELLHVSGYVRYLSDRPDYDAQRLLAPDRVRVWERLLIKLKEYEVLLALRRLVIPVTAKEGGLTCRAPNPRGGGLLPREVRLSASTRPMEFMTSWVVDPLVQRFGLIYDITDFSAIVSLLRRSGAGEQGDSYGQIFRFQRRVNQMARGRRLKLEKYLGDGALYSGRHPDLLLATAIQLQRYYRQVLTEGFPFDRGLRMALNYGQYRLLPIEESGPKGGHRYEFFGHGIVELSRLATGKAMREIDAVRTLLLGMGYPAAEVDRFFAPLIGENVDVVDKEEEERQFFSYVNRSGALVNEGIVATRNFVRELDEAEVVGPLHRGRVGQRRYVVFQVEDGADGLWVGLRRLGLASLKGLGRLPVYEVVDGESWRQGGRLTPVDGGLLETLEHGTADAMSASDGVGRHGAG